MSREFNILLSAYACRPNSGTEPGNGWNWATRLAERGMRIHVLTVTEGREPIERYCAKKPVPGLSFSYVEVPSRFRHTTGMHYAWWQWAAVGAARELHRKTPFDLVHHVTYSSIRLPTQLWRLGIPTIFGPVGGGQVTPSSMLRVFGANRCSERLRTAFTKLLPYSIWHRLWLSKMTLVLATNVDTLVLARRLTKTRVEPWFDAALPSGFFLPEPPSFSRREGPVRLLWLGRMVPLKALPLALDVLARVQCPATLTIAGEGMPSAVVQRMIAERGLGDRVYWAGRRLDREEVRQAYLEHDVLLFTSLRDSCPAQLVEAMGMGLPVITLDHHGARALVPDGAGIKVPVTTPEQVVRDMAKAVDHFAGMSSEEITCMSKIGWSFARTLSYEDGAVLFEDLYRQIVSRAPVLTAFPANARRILDGEPRGKSESEV